MIYNTLHVLCLLGLERITSSTLPFPILTYSNVKLIVVGWFCPGEGESVTRY